MATGGSLWLRHDLSLLKFHTYGYPFKRPEYHKRADLPQSSCYLNQDASSFCASRQIHRTVSYVSHRHKLLVCQASTFPDPASDIHLLRSTAWYLARSSISLTGAPKVLLVTAVGTVAFAFWGLEPLILIGRKLLFQLNDNTWKKSKEHYIFASYLRPLLLCVGAMLFCSSLDPLVLHSEASQVVKQHFLNLVRSLSAVLTFAYCLSSFVQQTQKSFTAKNDSDDPRNMGIEFAGRTIYTAIWFIAFALFMKLLGFPAQKWITAGGLGTVLLTLAGREIFTNFLSGVIVHATRPFVTSEWIQTKIDGYEVSGTVERVGWWSPTIIRGDDREAIHIPNHKFTVSVVRNLSQKTHWRIKTHLAISHLDANKINNIVADMRKVLSKNPQIEQQRLHRRVFLDNINPENQALRILISCFVKTSRFEEYLCVKEAILLDLLRVISHHRARLATPIRTVQKLYSDAYMENIPFAETIFTSAGTTDDRPYLLIEPSPRINGEEKAKSRTAPRASEDPAIEVPMQDSEKQQPCKVNSGDMRPRNGKVEAQATPPNDPPKSQLDPKASNEKPPVTESVGDQNDSVPPSTTKARTSFQDNIVLEVALEGSRRTLSFEEDSGPVSTPLEASRMSAARNGNSMHSSKSKKESTPDASTGEHRDHVM